MVCNTKQQQLILVSKSKKKKFLSVANRIISVGEHKRAERIASLFDNPLETKIVKADRGYITFTGTYRKVPISIIVTGIVSER